MNLQNKIKYTLKEIATLVRIEFLTIASNKFILLVLLGGILMYGFLYNFMYEPNVVEKVPVVVVDKSNTHLSRYYSRLLDATSKVEVLGHESDMIAAKNLLKQNKVMGIVYIPHDFESRLKRGEESVFISYGITDAFLYYSSLQESATGAMLELNKNYRPDMVVFLPSNSVSCITNAKPVTISKNILFNYTGGYGTYLIPAVLIVIIYQTLFMVIGMISGEERHSRSILQLTGGNTSFFSLSSVIISKTFVYSCVYAIFCLFLLGLLPLIFHLPNIGTSYDIIIFTIPYLLSTCFFALSMSIFFSDSEASVLMIPFFSVGLIFLSGTSYPLELMPWYWHAAHYVLPAPVGTMGFVKLNSMGAFLAQVKTEYVTLWIQCIVYFIFACMAYRHNIKKAIKQSNNHL